MTLTKAKRKEHNVNILINRLEKVIQQHESGLSLDDRFVKDIKNAYSNYKIMNRRINEEMMEE